MCLVYCFIFLLLLSICLTSTCSICLCVHFHRLLCCHLCPALSNACSSASFGHSDCSSLCPAIPIGFRLGPSLFCTSIAIAEITNFCSSFFVSKYAPRRTNTCQTKHTYKHYFVESCHHHSAVSRFSCTSLPPFVVHCHQFHFSRIITT